MSIIEPRVFLRLTAVLLMVFSIILFVFPGIIALLFNTNLTGAGVLFIRFLAASLAAHAYLNWVAVSFGDEILRQVELMNTIALVLAIIASGLGMVGSGLTITGLSLLIMHVTFLLGFAVMYRRVS